MRGKVGGVLLQRRHLPAFLNLVFSGAGFSLPSRDHSVRTCTKAKIGRIAAQQKRTGVVFMTA
jgi:hypothetical protein